MCDISQRRSHIREGGQGCLDLISLGCVNTGNPILIFFPLIGRDTGAIEVDMYRAVEAAEGRMVHNNSWNSANGMASNIWKPCV